MDIYEEARRKWQCRQTQGTLGRQRIHTSPGTRLRRDVCTSGEILDVEIEGSAKVYLGI